MKTHFLTLGFIFLLLKLNAQFTLNLEGTEIKSGKKIFLKEIGLVNEIGQALIETDVEFKRIGLRELRKYDFSVNNIRDFWQKQALINEVYESLLKYGPQYDLRRDWETEALQYLNELEEKNLVFNDSYLENYVYTLVYKIYPGTIEDKRPGIINLKIMIDNIPSSFIFPNGTLIVSTGLLSTVNSEQELTAIISHEIAHFVLDHSTINLNKSIQRQKSAEFWAAFATGLAAAVDIYTSTKNDYYIPGSLTYATAILSQSIAASFVERLGLKFSFEQERTADKCTIDLLKFLKIDSTALSSALTKIRDYCIITGNYYQIAGDATTLGIQNRINMLCKPNSFSSITYDKLISSVISTNAVIEFNNKHFEACNNLIERNIKAGIPTEDDYILKTMTNLCLYDNPEKNLENIDLINKAKDLNVAPTINVFKQEALVFIRLQKYSEALTALKVYSDKLLEEFAKIGDIKNETLWSSTSQYINNEISWTKKMIYKVSSM